MIRFVFAEEAALDMDELAEYIESLPIEPGVSLAEALQETLQRIVLFPGLGSLDPVISHIFQRKIHRRVCRDYVFFYALEPHKAEIIAVLHGKRDLMQILTGRAG